MMEMFPYPIRYFACRNYDEQQKQAWQNLNDAFFNNPEYKEFFEGSDKDVLLQCKTAITDALLSIVALQGEQDK